MPQRIKGDYENIVVDCPKGHKNIYNRVTDLGTTMPISYRAGLKCEAKGCLEIFNANGDRYTPVKYRWFLSKKDDLFLQKRYADCIAAICQATEAFLYQAIVNHEIDRNASIRNENGYVDTSTYDSMIRGLMIEQGGRPIPMNNATYGPLRDEFLRIYRAYEHAPFDTSRHLKEDKRTESFDILEHSTIGTTRNNTVHKYAYRPTKDEVESFDELVAAIFWLEKYFDIKDSVNVLNRL